MSKGKQKFLIEFWRQIIFNRMLEEKIVSEEKEIVNLELYNFEYGKRRRKTFLGITELAEYLYQYPQSNKLERFLSTKWYVYDYSNPKI